MNLSKESFGYLLRLLCSKLISVEWKERLETILCGLLLSELTAHGETLEAIENSEQITSSSLFGLCDLKFIEQWLSPQSTLTKSGSIAASLLISIHRMKQSKSSTAQSIFTLLVPLWFVLSHFLIFFTYKSLGFYQQKRY